MEDLKSRISKIALEKAKEQGVFLVELTLTGSGRVKILALIDSESGVTIDQCTKFSRSVTQETDLISELDEGYVIEVSSPGIDRPLEFPFQYKKNVGRKIRVTLDGDEEKEGELLTATEEGFSVKLPGLKKKEFINEEYQYNEVKKAKIIVSFK
ncbi:MAG: ribosome maturation factor rimP [Cytophagaceae bacterium]|jgi:ribosome maturation factor RimP|nr:ribosome maturation factor rimP [Cytophagaceae bacterium]